MAQIQQFPLRPRVAGACVLLLLVGSVVSGCRARSEEKADAPILRVGFGIGPSGRLTGLGVLTDFLYSEPLVVHEHDGRTAPALAESWVWDADRKTVRLRLRPGVKFHNGTPLTADAVARFLQQKLKSRTGFTYVTEISAQDDRTLVIRLSRPDNFLLPELTELRIAHPDAADIATGPFKLVSRTPVVSAVRFDEYHSGPPALGGVRIVTYDSHRGAWAALLRDEVDVVQEVSRESIEFIQGSSNVRTYGVIQPFYIYLSFNQRHPALRHVEVRRALSQALDRQAIIERAMRGRGRVADGPLWPFHWAYTPLTGKDAFNPEEARHRLDRAGFPMPPEGKAGERRTRLTFKCLVWNEEPQYERIALMVQRQLFNIGVDMQFEMLPLDKLTERAGSGDFDAYLIQSNGGRALDQTYKFWRSSGAANIARQQSGYAGADEELDHLRHSTTDVDTRAAVAAVARRFYDDAPAAFIAWIEVTRAVSAAFDVGDPKAQDPFLNIRQWRKAANSPIP